VDVNNLVVVSDLHCGCQFGLCPPVVRLDGGGVYEFSRFQRSIWGYWQMFWGDWVPTVTRGEPYAVVINGDALDGVHHKSVTQITHNESDQRRIAKAVLEPVVEACGGLFFMIRGTEAHVGASGKNEETLAAELNAIPDETGNHSRYEIWARVGGDDGCLVHLTHHIGTTGRTHYETSALMGEYGEMCVEAGRWGLAPPDVVVRSHRHRRAQIEVPSARRDGICFTTPGWQLKTPFIFRTNMRQSVPQVGGIAIRQGDMDLYAREKVWSLKRAKVTT